jgi:hypothetical protein
LRLQREECGWTLALHFRNSAPRSAIPITATRLLNAEKSSIASNTSMQFSAS